MRATARIAAGFILAGVVSLGARDQAYPELRPVDEASQHADFFTFRAHLQAAIARRDRDAVLAAVDVNIRNTFGDDNGLDAFRRRWDLESPDTQLWHVLGRTLALGGTFDTSGRFVAPYTFSRWPGDFDAFEHVVIVGARVRARASPRLDSGTLAVLSFAVVPIVRDARLSADLAPGWIAVRLADGRTGFVAAQYARSPIDYRAIFARAGSVWRLVTFIAGD